MRIRIPGRLVAIRYPAPIEKITIAILIVIILFGFTLIENSWSTNRWSLAYAKTIIASPAYPTDEFTITQDHPRSLLWIANDMYHQKMYDESLDVIYPLLVEGDEFAIAHKGKILLALGEDQFAIDAFAQAGDLNSLSEIARSASQDDDLYLAFLANKQICILAHDDSEACLNSGKYLIDQGKYSEADKYLELALLRDPNRRGTYLTRANALRKNKEYTAAIETYRLAIVRFPDYEQVYFELSSTYDLNGQSKEAMQAMDAALRLFTDPSEKYLLLAGRVYENGGDRQQALTIYRRILESNPNNQAAQKAIRRLEK